MNGRIIFVEFQKPPFGVLIKLHSVYKLIGKNLASLQCSSSHPEIHIWTFKNILLYVSVEFCRFLYINSTHFLLKYFKIILYKGYLFNGIFSPFSLDPVFLISLSPQWLPSTDKNLREKYICFFSSLYAQRFRSRSDSKCNIKLESWKVRFI